MLTCGRQDVFSDESDNMAKKNHYRVVLNAVLKLPWLEGLGALNFLDGNKFCCAIGAVIYGSTPQSIREIDITKTVRVRHKIGDYVEDEIATANDIDLFESPLERKHRMIVWLRERADAIDAEIARSKT